MALITEVKSKIKSLSSGDFQILCDAYLSKKLRLPPNCLGTMAGTSQTTKGTPDTYFPTKEGKYIFAEYTTQKTNLVSKIESG